MTIYTFNYYLFSIFHEKCTKYFIIKLVEFKSENDRIT